MPPYVIVATFDNGDPAAFGPYATYAEAKAALEVARQRYADEDDSVTSLDIVTLRTV